jgi:hypothetical protein
MNAINHPLHYGGDTPYEAIKVIEAWGLNFNLGNTAKYISRAELKGKPVQDLEKALWYLAREVHNRGGNIHHAIPTPEGEILVALRLALEHITEWEIDDDRGVLGVLEVLTKVADILNDALESVTPNLADSKKTVST